MTLGTRLRKYRSSKWYTQTPTQNETGLNRKNSGPVACWRGKGGGRGHTMYSKIFPGASSRDLKVNVAVCEKL